MVGWMPILGKHDVVEPLGETIERTGQIIVRQPVIGFCAIYCKRADRTQLKLKYWTETEDNELLARAWRAANTKARELGWIANSVRSSCQAARRQRARVRMDFVAGRPPMNLTEQQVRYIQDWAERAGVVETVRLYGSRAKGIARSDSDVNLALTVGTSHYVRFLNEWQKELSDALILKVMLKQYNSPADDTVRRYCDEFSVVLFPR